MRDNREYRDSDADAGRRWHRERAYVAGSKGNTENGIIIDWQVL